MKVVIALVLVLGGMSFARAENLPSYDLACNGVQTGFDVETMKPVINEAEPIRVRLETHAATADEAKNDGVEIGTPFVKASYDMHGNGISVRIFESIKSLQLRFSLRGARGVDPKTGANAVDAYSRDFLGVFYKPADAKYMQATMSCSLKRVKN